MITTKYKLENDRFVFRADYDDELNILYNYHEDKQTKETFISDNYGEFNGKVKFDKDTIDDYVKKAEGAAFPIMVDPIGFVFSYDDLEARKKLIGEDKFNEIVAKYPRLPKKLKNINLYTKVIYKVVTTYNIDTGEQNSRVVFDNTKDNWWSADDTPEYLSEHIFTPEEIENNKQLLTGVVYVNPIERHIWNIIHMLPKID